MHTDALAIWQGRSAESWRTEWRVGELRFYERVSSTNDIVTEMASAGAPHLSLALAEEQTEGRGRGGASWRAERGTSLLFSVLLRASQRGGSPGCAPVRVGLAVSQAISAMCGVEALVKWPNDVVFPGHGKVAGVLCEASFATPHQAHIVAGIGINVLQSARDFPTELQDTACSIVSATGVILDRAALLGSVLEHLRAHSEHVTQPLTLAELEQYQARDMLRGVEVLCDMGASGTVRGKARGVARDGALLVEQHDALVPIYSGTVRMASTHAYPGSMREL